MRHCRRTFCMSAMRVGDSSWPSASDANKLPPGINTTSTPSSRRLSTLPLLFRCGSASSTAAPGRTYTHDICIHDICIHICMSIYTHVCIHTYMYL